MNETLNFPEAVMLLLKRAYFSECTFVDELDEQGNPKIDAQGKTIKRAKHQNDITFKVWCEQYGLILNQNKIIDPASQPLKIIKPK
jgi:hypothetical protein